MLGMLPLRSAPSAGRLCCCFHNSVLGLLLSLRVNPSLLFSASSVIQGLWLLASSGALRYFLQTHYYDGGVRACKTQNGEHVGKGCFD